MPQLSLLRIKTILLLLFGMEIFQPVNGRQAAEPGATDWQELHAEGQVRPCYEAILARLGRLSPARLRNLRESMDATLREMGVTFNASGPEKVMSCDVLPHVFTQEEWDRIDSGLKQRLRAFELLLQDVYGPKEILRSGTLPAEIVLGSPHYQRASIDLVKPKDAYLHLSGVCLVRDQTGKPTVKHHHFAHASGLSYMMQNRRALARVVPEVFEDVPLRALADAPLALLESLRALTQTPDQEISVVLLSPGPGSAVYSEHSFLARRMGIPVVQGGDLLVLNDCVYLKTVQGLERVEVIYNRLADQWLDPLVFRSDSDIGVPGLMHCLRRGTVALINGIGSQLADDRSLLSFANRIIRFYLNEDPILPTLPTHWLGDIDQREMVLENLDRYEIRELFIDGLSGAELSDCLDPAVIRREGRRLVAQPRGIEAKAAQLGSDRPSASTQEHIVFALRQNEGFEVFPGALTRVSASGRTDFEGPWSSRDSWVLGSDSHLLAPRAPSVSGPLLLQQKVTSRVAESFYWMGRYLERAYDQAYLIQVVESLETEELNSAERKLYRPMWNTLLPPLEKSAGTSRRSITNRIDRYRLMLLPEAGSVASIFGRAFKNANSVLECLSPEAWAILNELHQSFPKYRKKLSEEDAARVARRIGELVTRMVPQFFATASATMLADDGLRFCRVGQLLERAIITGNALASVSKALTRQEHTTEIELSAFLRLLATRDAYRRLYQTRAEPLSILEFLWQNSQAPRSVYRCLQECASLLRESASEHLPGAEKPLLAIDGLCQQLKRVDWSAFVGAFSEDTPVPQPSSTQGSQLQPLLNRLLQQTLDIHLLISDGFLSHQANISQSSQPMFKGFRHGV